MFCQDSLSVLLMRFVAPEEFSKLRYASSLIGLKIMQQSQRITNQDLQLKRNAVLPDLSLKAKDMLKKGLQVIFQDFMIELARLKPNSKAFSCLLFILV